MKRIKKDLLNYKSIAVMPQFKYKEITKKIIGAAMKAHSVLGNGFQEVIYRIALEIGMRKSGLLFFFVEAVISVESKQKRF